MTFYLEERRVIPRSFGLLVGDCVHNLRSALDHLAYALPRATGTDPRWEKWSQWPICHDPKEFAKVAQRSLCGVDPRAVERIESCQPYYRGTDVAQHRLRYLAELSNLDKHRVLHGIAAPAQRGGFVPKPQPPGAVWAVFNRDGLEPGAVIGKIYFSEPAANPTDVTVSVTFGVTIANLEPPIGVETVLKDMHGYITYEVFTAVAPFLP